MRAHVVPLGSGCSGAVFDRFGGVSAPPYGELNLAANTGDDPSAVTENRMRAAEAVGLEAVQVAWMTQVHGTDVAVLAQAPAAPVDGVDALVTAKAGVALAVLVADCVPVLLADAGAGVVAAAHAGRRGASDGVLTATLSAMQELGARPASIRVHLGPSICGRCYEVPSELQSEVAARLPAARCTTGAGTPGLDLRAGLHEQLRNAGVGHVTVSSACTVEDPTLFSYRREGRTGRFAGLVWRR